MVGSQRNGSLEWCKLISILAVVYQHSVGMSSTLFTHFAVPAFTFISVYFATVAGNRSQVPKKWLIERSSKLYILFLKWNVFYAVLRWLSFVASGTLYENAFKITPLELLLTGCANAMYYLPFIIAANAIGFVIAYSTTDFNRFTSITFAIFFFILGLWLTFSLNFADARFDLVPFDTHMVRKSMPAVALVICWHFLSKMELINFITRRWLLTFAAILLVTGFWHLLEYQRVCFYGETAAGLGAVLLFLALSDFPWPDIPPNLSLWLFISHSFLLHGVRFVSKMIRYDYDVAPGYVQITAAFTMMAILIIVYYWLLDNSPQRLKWVLAG